MGFDETTVLFPRYGYDEKAAFVKVYAEDDKIHLAWRTLDGGVIVFEDIPLNYPRSSLHYYDLIEKYAEVVSQVDWVVSEIFRKHGVRVYDNGGETFDRYIVVIGGEVYSVSSDPLDPQSVNTHLGREYEVEIRGEELDADEVPENVIRDFSEKGGCL